ncbi:hypothetical protein SK128_024842, partial [Halocaridina rubra]
MVPMKALQLTEYFLQLRIPFHHFKIPISNIIGFGSDGCSTMMDANISVSSRSKELCP